MPFIVKWKGRIPAGATYSRPVIQLDVLPTALAAAGIKLDANNKFDGVNLLPFISRRGSARPHDTLYWRTGGMMAIRKGDWKLLRMTDAAYTEQPYVIGDLSALQLYNLSDDISEAKNLAAANPKKVKELAADWTRWAQSLAIPAWSPRQLPTAGETR